MTVGVRDVAVFLRAHGLILDAEGLAEVFGLDRESAEELEGDLERVVSVGWRIGAFPDAGERREVEGFGVLVRDALGYLRVEELERGGTEGSECGG